MVGESLACCSSFSSSLFSSFPFAALHHCAGTKRSQHAHRCVCSSHKHELTLPPQFGSSHAVSPDVVHQLFMSTVTPYSASLHAFQEQ